MPGVDVRAVGPADAALHRRPAADPAAAGLRRWACSPTCCSTGAATTWSTPRRSPTSRCWPRRWCARWAASPWWSTGTRCGPAPTGASTWAGPAAIGALGAAAVRAGAPARLLLLPPARRAAAPRGAARRGHRAGGRVRGRPEPPRPRARGAGGGLRRPPHPREARARAGATRWRSRGSGCPGCAATSSATVPSAPKVERRDRRRSTWRRRCARTASSTARRWTRPCRARCAWCSPRCARATAWW